MDKKIAKFIQNDAFQTMIIGTIFSIQRRVSKGDGPGELRDCLQVGRRQVAAGYVLYGSSTMLVYTTGDGVHGFTYDPTVGEFFLSHENLKIPRRGSTFSPAPTTSATLPTISRTRSPKAPSMRA